MPKITIQRNRTGSNPLFYCVHDGKFYHAASVRELLAISGLKPRLNTESLAAITLTGPGRPLHSAVFAGVHELMPGYRAEFDEGELTVTQYWKPLAKEHTETFEETAARVREMLTASIVKNLHENPCLFLSGGLDSSIIGAVMKQSGSAIASYSVDYTGNRDNYQVSDFSATQDAPFVVEMVEFLSAEHCDVILDTETLFESLKPAVFARGLPGMADVDGAMWLFCNEVGKSQTSAFSGECADETGYIRWGSGEGILEISENTDELQITAVIEALSLKTSQAKAT